MRFTREDACLIWLAAAEVGESTLDALLETFETAEGIYDAMAAHGPEPFKPFLKPAMRKALQEGSGKQRMHDRLQKLIDEDIGVLRREDERFPEVLRQIPDPVWLLFCKGDLNCLMGRHAAIVGSRKASDYGLLNAQSIARDLSRSGVIIISGMAEGIDTAAHLGCMEGGSPTIAVLGSGLDDPYPCGRRGLDKDILDSGGLLLSEYAPGSAALPYHFPLRNRIVSGLSDAVLYMEGKIKGGGMLTVNHALNQGKEVFAFPGEVGLIGSEGPLQMIRDGATLFRNAEDVLFDMKWEEAVKPPAAALQDLPPLPPDQQTILALLTTQEASYEQLTERTGLDAAALNTALTLLELTGLIRKSAGRVYHKA